MDTSAKDHVSNLEAHWLQIRDYQMRDFRASSLFQLVAKYVRGPRVLDVGCGTGGMVAFLQLKGFDVIGIDRSETMVTNARAALKAAGLSTDLVRLCSVTDVEEQFSSVVSLDVIEHVEDDWKMLRAMAIRVQPGGRLIVAVPAIPWLFGPKDIAFRHYRRYTPRGLYSAVAQTGLSMIKLRHWNFCGLLPTIIATKILQRKVDEGFRYSQSLKWRVMQRLLGTWLQQVENRLDMPTGLSLLAVAERSQR